MTCFSFWNACHFGAVMMMMLMTTPFLWLVVLPGTFAFHIGSSPVLRPVIRHGGPASPSTTISLSTTPSSWSNLLTCLHNSESDNSSNDSSLSYALSIEYCTGCRWMLKSFWLAQEVLTTFESSPAPLEAVTILPNRGEEGGVFTVKLTQFPITDSSSDSSSISRCSTLLWNRSQEGAFPSPKIIKQKIRDEIAPQQFLGHSDTTQRQEESTTATLPVAPGGGSDETTSAFTGSGSGSSVVQRLLQQDDKLDLPPLTPAISITYCTGCKWLLRAAYFGQELLTTFATELNSVTLVPSKPPAKGGQFTIALNGNVLFDRTTEGRFPEVKEVKQLIRDALAPSKDLGHSDTQDRKEATAVEKTELSEEDAAAQRRMFGVS